MSRSSALCASLLVLGVFGAAAVAGDLNNWRTIPLPAGAGSFGSIGTTVTFQTGTDVHLWSGVSKQWTVVPIVTGISFFEQYNAYVVFRDGNDIHGWSTREDVVDTITVSPTATIKSGPVSSSWVTIVVDGTQAWGFSGFRGHWVPLTLSAPSPTIVANRLLGIIKDGTNLHAFSAHWGTFVTTPGDASAAPAVSGEAECGTAHSPGIFRAFSAQQNTWTTQAIAGITTNVLRSDYALAVAGNTVFGYSGLSGTLTSWTSTAPIGTITADEGCAAFLDPALGKAVCYGSGPGIFSGLSVATATLQVDNDYALVVEPGQVTPYSALTGTYGPALAGTYTISKADEVAFADSAGTDYAYSALLNQWFAAPIVTPVGAPVLVRSSVVIPHTGGYEALSARYGTWVSQATSTPNQFLAPSSGATFCAFDDPAPFNVFVFDSRLNRWEPASAPNPLTVQISRHTCMANDGISGFGFGMPTGRFDKVNLHGQPVTSFSTSSSSGYIVTPTEFHSYSVQGSLSYEGRFPEFTRAINLGNTLRLHQAGPAGSALIMFVGVAPGHYFAGPIIGWLDIDPSFLIVSSLPQTIPASGMVQLDFSLPQVPVLVGIQPHVQNAVIPPGGVTPYLSTSVAPYLY